MKKSSNTNNSTKPEYVSSKRSNVKRRLRKLDPPPFFEVFLPVAQLRVLNPIKSHCSRCGYDTSSETLHHDPERGYFAVLTCRNCGKIHFIQKRFSQLLKFVENGVFQREEARERWDRLIIFSGEGGEQDA
jgi:hypothetical protein